MTLASSSDPQPQSTKGPGLSTSDRGDGPPIFPGWRWAAVALAFPVAGLIGRAVGGDVDAVGAALIGGALTGAGLGAAQWLAAREMFGQWPVWVGASAVGYGVGLAAGAALVDYETDLGSLAAMGAVSGALLGAGQGFALAAQDRRRLAMAWAPAMPALFAIGWSATTIGGIDVDKQFTVFGAYGAVVFTLLSGLLLARFMPAQPQVK
jgi:hypothetical protein